MARELTLDERIKHMMYENKATGQDSYGYWNAYVKGQMSIEAEYKKRSLEDYEILQIFGLTLPEVMERIEFYNKNYEKPIFEIKYSSGVHTYKIWANGRTEGFNDKVVVVNRIPELEAKIRLEKK